MKITVSGYTVVEAGPVVARCPHCSRSATFEKVALNDLVVQVPGGPLALGQRRCPNPECFGHVFFLRPHPKGAATLYPPEKIDFEKKDVPEKVARMLEEAIVCHSTECYTAAAIMIRRTLEEICADRGAAGKNLQDRIEALRGKVVLPTELLEAMHDLRILGNDAAHIESKVYDVGRDEVEAGIDLAKTILQATYQLNSLVEKLRALKKPPA